MLSDKLIIMPVWLSSGPSCEDYARVTRPVLAGVERLTYETLYCNYMTIDNSVNRLSLQRCMEC